MNGKSPMKVSVSSSPGRPAYRSMPGSIWALGFVSMFMDISSELVHSLLPVFMTSVLGASMTAVGVIEGIAEAAASITKVFSGALSDYFRKRKALAVVGYGLAAVTKPLFPLARTVWWIFTARFVDRIGKGIRGAPRDALIADIAPPELLGAAYGLRQALDTAGAFLGPLLAVLLMRLLAGDIEAVLWSAVAPAFIAVALLAVAVREPEVSPREKASVARPTLANARRLQLRYWLIVGLGAVFALSRFSEAFLILRAHGLGLSIGYVPLIMIVMNVFYSAFAYPAGIASDRFSPRALLVFGLALLIGADLALAVAASFWTAFIGAALWGLHMAFTQGLFSKLVADTAPAELRGTAFGIFNLLSGLSLLMASIVAGALWSTLGPAATFMTGAFFAALAILGIIIYRPGARTA